MARSIRITKERDIIGNTPSRAEEEGEGTNSEDTPPFLRVTQPV